MSPKKGTETPLSPEDTSQVQYLLEQYQYVAARLHTTTDQTQAETALNTITSSSEPAQTMLLKALAKEKTVAAADVLTAVNSLSPHKEIRKEARRALIHLEGSKIYPRWNPPTSQTPAVQVHVANPPRFWKGFASQTREEGELQLILCWEQGYDYSEIRMLSFLLDFWQDGVKDFFIDTSSRRRADQRISELRSKLAETDRSLLDCTLAEGKRLIEDALSINAWHSTPINAEYHNQTPILNKLILQATDPDEDRGHTFITPDMADQEVVVNFLGGWSMGDYGLSYDLLTHDSPLRADLTRNAWIELHRAWATEARPARMELGFVHERKQPQSSLWLPSSATSQTPARKDIEIGWSLELLETPLSGTLKEMPMGTSVNKETGRHWFWTSYTLVREKGAWRIQQATDEGVRTQILPIEELQKRIKDFEAALEQSIQQHDSDVQAFIEETSWRLSQLLHFYDALLIKLPLDKSVYEDAYNSAVLTGNPERVMVYLERLSQRFSDDRANTLRRLGSTLAGLAFKEGSQALAARRHHLLERAETILREAVILEDSALSHMLLGELLMSQDRNEEAEAELILASEKQPTTSEAAAVEAGLGNLAMRREQMAEAIPHYQRVAELEPTYAGVWFSLGFAHRLLGAMDKAKTFYLRALELEPNDIRTYAELTAIYMHDKLPEEAQKNLEQAVRINPDSAHLYALLASVLFEMGDKRGAQRQLEEAERIDPSLEIVQSVRQHIYNTRKK